MSLRRTTLVQGPPGPPGPGVLVFGTPASNTSTSVPAYLPPGFGTLQSTTVDLIIPTSGTILQMWVRAGTAGAGGSKFTVEKSGVPTAMTATLAAGLNQVADITDAFTVSAGDRIRINNLATSAGSPPANVIVTVVLGA